MQPRSREATNKSTRANNEIVVTNNGDNSILVFARDASGDVPPRAAAARVTAAGSE